MVFNIGEKVIHWTYGLGEIIRIEEKTIHGHLTNCYVLQTASLMIWVPIDEQNQVSLRVPTAPDNFDDLFAILRSPGEPLPEDRVERKDYLFGRLKDGRLASICEVIRDLHHYKRASKLNDQEKSILEQSVNSLLTEWTYSTGIPRAQAERTMNRLLGESA